VADGLTRGAVLDVVGEGPTDVAPAATVTFLFTDIEGSTRLLRRLGTRYAAVLDDHQAIIRQAVADAGGTEVDTQGDSFFVAFATPSQAVRAAIAAQRALLRHPWPDEVEVGVRMGVHTGEAVLTDGRYVGFDVHRAARIAAAAHGGQIVLSEAARGVVERRLPENVHVRNLGRHRLKDLPLPEQVFQLVVPGLPVVFPPLRSLETQLTNLPAQVTSFVGRRRETDQARRLLRRTRLLTFTGPGGTGKTRLALEVAGRVLSDYPDGVFFVPLAAVADPSLVPAAVAAAVGLPTGAGPPAGTQASVVDTLHEYLAGRKLLLVLDNFEHLMAAAPVVEGLLQAGPRFKVLVTSRARLHVSGEQELPVAPLETPEPVAGAGVGDLARYDALALFEQRARAADPGLPVTDDTVATMAKICARLDGLPLAIELAAARLNVLTPELLLERLERALPLLTAGPRDAPARQRTLRDTVSWSHDLLDGVDRVVFRRLSVFSGGCTLDAAEAVVGTGDVNVLDGISSLVAKSLVRRTAGSSGGPRFRMLETIREYAYERLVESGEAPEVERRHARFYLQQVAGADAQPWQVTRPGPAAGAEWDLDNLRAALERSIRAGDAETGLGIASSMWRCWQQRGQLEEGRRWTSRLLALPGAAPRTLWRARGLCASAGMAYWQGDYGPARLHYEEALSICRELDDRRGAAEALQSLAYLAGIRGDHPEAFTLHRQSSTISRELGDLGSVAYDCVGEGMVHNVEGDFEAARERFEEARSLFEQVGDSYGLASVLCLLSRLAAEQGDVDGATASWCQAFELLRELGDSSGIIIALSDLCAIQLAAGRPEAAVRLAGAAQGLGRELKVRPPTALTRPLDPRLAARTRIGEAAVRAAWDAGAAMTLDQAIDYALELTAPGATSQGATGEA